MPTDGVLLESETKIESDSDELQIPTYVEYDEVMMEQNTGILNQIDVEEILPPKFVSYHPGLLDIESLQRTPDLQYSTHLPFVTELPLKKGRVLKLLSWNVELQTVNLFGPAKRAMSFEAVPEIVDFFDSLAMTQRQSRIAQSLQRMVKKKNQMLFFFKKRILMKLC